MVLLGFYISIVVITNHKKLKYFTYVSFTLLALWSIYNNNTEQCELIREKQIREEENRKAELERKEQRVFREWQVARAEKILDQNLSTDETKILIAEIIKLKPEEKSKDNDQWAKDVIEFAPKRLQDRKILSLKEKEFGEKLEAQWSLFGDEILEYFDNQILGLEKKIGGITTEKSEDVKYLNYYNLRHEPSEIRKVTFPNHTSIQIEIHPGIIRSGKLTSSSALYFKDTNSPYGAITIIFHEEQTAVDEANGLEFETNKNPATDEVFVSKTKEVISNMIIRVYDDDVLKGQKK